MAVTIYVVATLNLIYIKVVETKLAQKYCNGNCIKYKFVKFITSPGDEKLSSILIRFMIIITFASIQLIVFLL